ncbi:MAG: phosphate acyltransferase PlsX [Oscillospiraceae bacterium]|nr:phosphate acyltransferase PlsX [Oscillospiraceae bacterium]
MKIIVDAMGGDKAPLEIVKGAALAVQELNVNIVLVGDEKKINRIISENNLSDILNKNTEIVHTEKVITMEDDPVSVVRANKDSSMGIALKMLADDKTDEYGALVSAGNSGALLAGATLIVKCIKDIKRAALAVVLPFERKTLLIDAGANVDIKAEYLKQFGFMGSIYMKKIFGIESPTVGLVNNGAEKSKGTAEHVEAYKLLSETKTINFVGNIEGSDITMRPSDVLVTDGFTGNIILKLTEGFGSFMGKKLKSMFLKDIFTKVSAVLVKDSMNEFKKSLDPAEYGGAPFLGVKKPVIKAHGSSDARAVKNAIRQAKFCIDTKLVEEIEIQSQINK